MWCARFPKFVKFRAVMGLGPGISRAGKVAMRVIVMEVAERLRIVKFSDDAIERGVEGPSLKQAFYFDFFFVNIFLTIRTPAEEFVTSSVTASEVVVSVVVDEVGFLGRHHNRFCSVMDSTRDFDSRNLGSIPSKTFFNDFFFVFWLFVLRGDSF